MMLSVILNKGDIPCLQHWRGLCSHLCVVALFGVLQTTTDTALIRPAEASEKRFVPAAWISQCKYTFRIVGAEYMLAQVVPQGSRQSKQWAGRLWAVQDSCGPEPATLQEYRGWKSALPAILSKTPRGRSEEQRAASYYAHWCVAKDERIAADREIFSRIREYISDRDAARLTAEQDKAHSALEAFCQMPFAVKTQSGQTPTRREIRAFRRHGTEKL